MSGAEIRLRGIYGDGGKQIPAAGENNTYLGSPITETDSDGYFELRFKWSGTEIATEIGRGGRTIIDIVAAKEIWHDSPSNTTYLSPQQSTAI